MTGLQFSNNNFAKIYRKTLKAMFHAVHINDIESVKKLCPLGAYATVRNENALWNASYNGQTEIVDILLQNGARPILNLPYQDASPLFVAVMRSHVQTALLLIHEGANVNFRGGVPNESTTGYTILYVAAYNGLTEIVQMLIQAGADVNRMSAKCHIPLFAACTNGHYEIARILILSGSHINIECEGKSPLEIAESPQIRQLLLNSGAHEAAPRGPVIGHRNL